MPPSNDLIPNDISILPISFSTSDNTSCRLLAPVIAPSIALTIPPSMLAPMPCTKPLIDSCLDVNSALASLISFCLTACWFKPSNTCGCFAICSSIVPISSFLANICATAKSFSFNDSITLNRCFSSAVVPWALSCSFWANCAAKAGLVPLSIKSNVLWSTWFFCCALTRFDSDAVIIDFVANASSFVLVTCCSNIWLIAACVSWRLRSFVLLSNFAVAGENGLILFVGASTCIAREPGSPCIPALVAASNGRGRVIAGVMVMPSPA